jgi:Ca-activated chloride channel family protein
VEDLEALRATGRDQGRLDQEIERTGLDFQIATRLTSWVAITEQRTVDPEAKRRAENVLQELPHGMNAAALGLRAPSTTGAVTGKVGAPVMILEADEEMALERPPMARTLDDDFDETEDRLASPSKRQQEASGVLFSLKELVSLEETRARDEEPMRAPAPRASSPRLAAPSPAQAPAPSSPVATSRKSELRTRLGRRAEMEDPPAPSMSAGDFQDRGGPEERPSMPLQGMPLPSMPPQTYAPRSARKSRARWLVLGMLLLLIATLVYWFFLRR